MAGAGRATCRPCDLQAAACLLPTPRSSDAVKGSPNQHDSRGRWMLTSAIAHLPGRNPAKARSSGKQAGRNCDAGQTLRPVDWGQYEPAIRRWERVLTLPAPAPAEPSGDGRQRLSAAFVEWMLGLPPGFVTGISVRRSAHLRILGNGVVPQQAAAALRTLLQAAAVSEPCLIQGTEADSG